jgi:hypothetical protein
MFDEHTGKIQLQTNVVLSITRTCTLQRTRTILG